MGNQTREVSFLWDKVENTYIVNPPIIYEVEPGDTVIFNSPDSNAKISFLDSGIINITGWETIDKGKHITKEVGSLVNDGTYYYAVMCEHEDRKYWYAEGNSCPAMKVGP